MKTALGHAYNSNQINGVSMQDIKGLSEQKSLTESNFTLPQIKANQGTSFMV